MPVPLSKASPSANRGPLPANESSAASEPDGHLCVFTSGPPAIGGSIDAISFVEIEAWAAPWLNCVPSNNRAVVRNARNRVAMVYRIACFTSGAVAMRSCESLVGFPQICLVAVLLYATQRPAPRDSRRIQHHATATYLSC